MSSDKERLDYLSSMLAENLVELSLWGGRYQLAPGCRAEADCHPPWAARGDRCRDGLPGGRQPPIGGGLVFQGASSADQPLVGLAGALGSMRSFDRHISKC